MNLGWDYSKDWDRECDRQDEEMAAEQAWWQNNSDRVLNVVCAILSSGNKKDGQTDADVVDRAEKIVRLIESKEGDMEEDYDI